MKVSLSLTILATLVPSALGELLGQDVSNYQGSLDWAAQKEAGSYFAYIKATESTTYTDAQFSANYDGAADAGIIRGAYHFARPAASSGKEQAQYFLDNGGGWTNDGKTLPGALDIEFNPDGDTCYGLSTTDMVAWIQEFSDTYKAAAGRPPTIYTTTSWWNQCTGSNSDFGDHPLWLARYADSAGDPPAGWDTHSIWQFADSGTLAGDNNYWNGDEDGLNKFAKGE